MEGVKQAAEMEKESAIPASNPVDCACMICNNRAANFECLLCLKKGNRRRRAVFCSHKCYKEHFQQHRIESSLSKFNALSPRNSAVSSETSSSCCPDSPLFDMTELEGKRKGCRRHRSSKNHLQSTHHHPHGYWPSPEWSQTVPMMNSFPLTPQQVPLVQWMPPYLCWVMYP